jgi:hypothetical protein
MSVEVHLLHPSDELHPWDTFVDSSPQGSIFCRSWWLNAVCNDQFSILALKERGEIVAGMPLPYRRRYGWKYFHMPPLTQTLGPLLPPPRSPKYRSQISREVELLEQLVSHIPQYDSFSIRCHYALSNWLPFHWAGYHQTTRYTYVIENLEEPERVFERMSSSYRNKIRKARKSGIKVVESNDVEALLVLTRKTFARQGLDLPYSEEVVTRIDQACAHRGKRKIFLTRDAGGRLHSALLVIYDQKSMYNLIQGSDPDLRHSGANILAMWHSIRFAQQVTAKYDFEGSMLKNVERVFRDFGAQQKRYFHITRTDSLPIKITRDVRSWVRRLGV